MQSLGREIISFWFEKMQNEGIFLVLMSFTTNSSSVIVDMKAYLRRNRQFVR